MEINAIDFISKYKDLLANGVEVDPYLAKAQSIYLNKLVVDNIGSMLSRNAHSYSLSGPSDVFKKTLTLFSLIGKEAPVVIKSDCLPLIKELTGLTSFNAYDEAWDYIHKFLGHLVLDLRCRNTCAFPHSEDDLYLRINRKIPPLTKNCKPKMFDDVWEEFRPGRFSICGDVGVEIFFTTKPFYYLDDDDVRGVNVSINVTRRF